MGCTTSLYWGHLAKAEPRLWPSLSLAQEACAPAFEGARAHLQNINSPGTKRCLLGYLRVRIQKLASDSQTESLKTSVTVHSRLLICSLANMFCALSPPPTLHLPSRGLQKVHSLTLDSWKSSFLLSLLQKISNIPQSRETSTVFLPIPTIIVQWANRGHVCSSTPQPQHCGIWSQSSTFYHAIHTHFSTYVKKIRTIFFFNNNHAAILTAHKWTMVP